MVAHAIISNRLDYCNSLRCGIAGNLLQKLQSTQNAAARLIMRTGRRQHITPVLQELHWLPVRQRIDFKMAVLVYKSLHGQLPQYLVEDCQLLTDIGCRSLQSADLDVPQREHVRVSETEVFPSLDSLSGTLYLSHYVTDISLEQFKRLLKTL